MPTVNSNDTNFLATNSSSINNSGVDTLRQVEAKYPALLFKQQLTTNVEKKNYGMIRDNLKKEIKKGERVAYSLGIDSAHWKKTRLAFKIVEEAHCTALSGLLKKPWQGC